MPRPEFTGLKIQRPEDADKVRTNPTRRVSSDHPSPNQVRFLDLNNITISSPVDSTASTPPAFRSALDALATQYSDGKGVEPLRLEMRRRENRVITSPATPSLPPRKSPLQTCFRRRGSLTPSKEMNVKFMDGSGRRRSSVEGMASPLTRRRMSSPVIETQRRGSVVQGMRLQGQSVEPPQNPKQLKKQEYDETFWDRYNKKVTTSKTGKMPSVLELMGQIKSLSQHALEARKSAKKAQSLQEQLSKKLVEAQRNLDDARANSRQTGVTKLESLEAQEEGVRRTIVWAWQEMLWDIVRLFEGGPLYHRRPSYGTVRAGAEEVMRLQTELRQQYAEKAALEQQLRIVEEGSREYHQQATARAEAEIRVAQLEMELLQMEMLMGKGEYGQRPDEGGHTEEDKHTVTTCEPSVELSNEADEKACSPIRSVKVQTDDGVEQAANGTPEPKANTPPVIPEGTERLVNTRIPSASVTDPQNRLASNRSAQRSKTYSSPRRDNTISYSWARPPPRRIPTDGTYHVSDSATMEQILRRILERHVPSALPCVPTVILSWTERESELMALLQQQYKLSNSMVAAMARSTQASPRLTNTPPTQPFSWVKASSDKEDEGQRPAEKKTKKVKSTRKMNYATRSQTRSISQGQAEFAALCSGSYTQRSTVSSSHPTPRTRPEAAPPRPG